MNSQVYVRLLHTYQIILNLTNTIKTEYDGQPVHNSRLQSIEINFHQDKTSTKHSFRIHTHEYDQKLPLCVMQT